MIVSARAEEQYCSTVLLYWRLPISLRCLAGPPSRPTGQARPDFSPAGCVQRPTVGAVAQNGGIHEGDKPGLRETSPFFSSVVPTLMSAISD